MGVPNVLIVSMASDLGWSIGELADPRAANGFVWTVSTLGLGDTGDYFSDCSILPSS